MIRLKTFILSALFFSASCLGQSHKFLTTHFQAKEGLTASTVYCVKQDQNGFLWIGTDNGLYKYDGEEFNHYNASSGLTDLEIFDISIGDNGIILLHNFSSTNDVIFQDKVQKLNLPTIKENDDYRGIGKGSYIQNNRFVILGNRINQLDFSDYVNNKKVSSSPLDLQIAGNVINIKEVGESFIIFNSRKDSLVSYDVLNQSVNTNTLYINDCNISSIGSTYGSGVWASNLSGNGLNYYMLTEKQILKEEKSIFINYTAKNVYYVDSNELWVTLSEGGVLHIVNDTVSSLLFEDISVNYVFKDQDKNIWIGTYGHGLYKVKNTGVLNYNLKHLRVSDKVLSLAKGDNGSVYLGFDKLIVTEFTDKTINHWNLQSSPKKVNRRVLDLEKTESGTILCGTDNGIFEINKPMSLIRKVNHGSTKAIVVKNGKWYIGSSGTLTVLDGNNLNSTSIWDTRTISVSVDDSANILCGTTHGLYIRKYGQDEVLILDDRIDYKISDIKINKDFTYLATDSGVCILNSGAVTFITENEGLSSNTCSKMFIDGSSLWVGTKSGLNKIEFNNGTLDYKIIPYTTYSGLLSNEINDILITNETVWVATNGGLSVFEEKNIKTDRNLKVNITSFSSSGNEYSIYKPISIEPNTGIVEVGFAGLSFGDQLTYFYRLEPEVYESERTSNGLVSFHQLEHGDYTFSVYAMDPLGNKSDTVSLPFTIRPNFYETTWFKVIMLLLLIGSVVFVFLWNGKRIKEKLKQKNELESKISGLELEAIKAQINPHFIYNCLNSIQFTIVNNKNLDAEKQLGVFAQLIRDTLDFSKLDFISLAKELEYLENYIFMQKMRFKEKLQFEIQVNTLDSLDSISMPSMLLQPYLENAIKHGMETVEGKQSQISLRFTQNEQTITCEIEDSGKGFDDNATIKDSVPSGNNITNQRVETYNKLHNTDIKVMFINKNTTSIETTGTIVKVIIPYK